MSIMQDEQTDTLWNHITGEALYGPLAGRRLEVSNLLQMNARQALEVEPNTEVAISSKPYWGAGRTAGPKPAAALSPLFAQTIGHEDARRPRMELGLGVWNGSVYRFYPLEALEKHEAGAVIDAFAGRRLLVYVDRETGIPAALFVQGGAARREGTDLVVDDGSIVRSGRLIARDGQAKSAERPRQLFTRWYAFSLTFTRSEVYGEPRS